MKEILDEESKNALINYRIQRAYETLKEAQVMMRESFYNAAVNRLYYACYYAAVSLLLKYDHQPQTHNGVKTMLGLHFISTGKLPIPDIVRTPRYRRTTLGTGECTGPD